MRRPPPDDVFTQIGRVWPLFAAVVIVMLMGSLGL